MSTRCQIEFKHIRKFSDKKVAFIQRRTIYRHSDGYPDGVIPDLQEFLKWNAGRNDDIEYQVANFIYWSKRWHEENYWTPKGVGQFPDSERKKWSDISSTNCSTLHIGFGVCENDGFHGDIEYFYEVVYEFLKAKPKVYIKVYEIVQKDYSKPITRKNLKLIKTIQIKEQTK